MKTPDFEIRPGLGGWLDRIVGPHGTPGELWLQFVPSISAAIALPLVAISWQLPWNSVQLAIATLFAFDLTGGIVTNATPAAKRWYHRPGQTFRHHFGFVAIHGLHLFIVATLFRGGDWFFFGLTYSFLLLGSSLILTVPRDLGRPVALLLCGIGLLFGFYLIPPTVGLEWFLPFLWLKLFVGHLLPE